MPGVSSSRERGPDGREMLVVNGTTYEWEEGIVELGKAIVQMYEEGLGPGCNQCGFMPCVVQHEQGEDLFQIADEMKDRGNPNPFSRIPLLVWWKQLMTTGFGCSSVTPLPSCVTNAIDEKYPDERLYQECPRCEYAPCVLYSLEAQRLLHIGRGMQDSGLRNDMTRFFLYRNFTRLIHDEYERPLRLRLPECVVEVVKDSFPNQENLPCIQFTEGLTVQPGATIDDLAVV